ncbi:DUF3048 domain-containing protein [Candidatus Woesebacteria bacterium]|nr:DUF3048 domain-containing protein [Candidatus Woesebacteria bacterium]
MKKQALLVTLGLYLVSSVVSFMAFSALGGNATSVQNLVGSSSDETETTGPTKLGMLLDINPTIPKNQPCPLNGKMFTQAEKESWEKRRPLAVMIENAPDARPQSGISDADVVFEAVAEGGVTRFMGIFYCGVQAYDTTLAPIRSARSYFVDWASGFNRPLYVHVGGANLPGPADALGQINQYGWALENDLNQFSIGYPTFVRNANRVSREVATEHTMETTTEKLWAVGEKREWTNLSPVLKVGRTTVPAEDWKDGYTPWTFEDDQTTDGAVAVINYSFWTGYNQYAVRWEYNAETNAYKRFLADQPHTDLNDSVQVEAKNVIVLLSPEKGPIDEAKHMLYKTTGTGDAVLFKNGEATKITWSKKTRESEISFLDTKGKAVTLARGETWISVLDPSFDFEY